MKVLGISKKPRSYIPTQFISDEFPPVFTIRSLTKREQAEVDAAHPISAELLESAIQASRIAEDESITAEQRIEKLKGYDYLSLSAISRKRQLAYLRLALSGWSNVPVREGAGISMLEFSPDNIDCLDDDMLAELANEVLGIVSQEDRQGLEEPSSPQSGQEAKTDGTV